MVVIQVIAAIEVLMRPDLVIFWNERAQFNLSNFVEDVKIYVDFLQMQSPEYLQYFYFLFFVIYFFPLFLHLFVLFVFIQRS